MGETITAGKFGWSELGANNGYVKLENFTVPAADLPPGDVYPVRPRPAGQNGIISTVKSNEFVTI